MQFLLYTFFPINDFVYGKNVEPIIEEYCLINDKTYNLKWISVKYKPYQEPSEFKYNSHAYSFHGDSFKTWWLEERENEKTYPIKIYNTLIFQDKDILTLFYCCYNDIIMTQHGKESIGYIWGQNHIICQIHTVPSIPVPDRKAKHKCERKYFFESWLQKHHLYL